MCGIVSINFLGKLDRKEEIQRQEIGQYFLTELLVETQTRGSDATGIAGIFDNGNYVGLKNGISAVDFVTKNEDKETSFTGLMNAWSKLSGRSANQRDAKIILGHCRKSSVGNSYNNVNNHPIHIDPIIGIHNGTLNNDDVIFKNIGCKRDGQVDSEAIMHLIYKNTDGGKKPFTLEALTDVANKLEGAYAVLAANSNNPYQLAFLRDDRPLEVCLIRKLNMLIIASERTFLNRVLFRYKKMVEVLPQIFKTIDTKWPALKEEDVDFKTIPNRELGMFNLVNTVQDVTDQNKKVVVEDFMIRDDISYTNKIWKVAKSTSTSAHSTGYTGAGAQHHNRSNFGARSTTNNNANGSHTNTSNAATNKDHPAAGAAQKEKNRQVATTSAKASSGNKSGDKGGDKGKVSGKLWVKSLNRYRDVTEDEIKTLTSDAGFLELSEKEEDKSNDTADKKKKEASQEHRDMLVANRLPSFRFNEVGVEMIEDIMPADEDKKAEEASETENLPMISVDTSNNPVAIEFAEKYKKKLLNYSTLDEVAADIGLSNGDTVDNLDKIPLVNRIHRKFKADGCYTGFVMGYNHRKEEEQHANIGVKEEKGKRRDKLIKTHKFVTKIMGEVIANQSSGQAVGTPKDFIHQVMDKKGTQVDIDDFNKLFTKYEIEQDSILKTFYDALLSFNK